MKKIAIISALILASATTFIGCGNKREPGRIYMPDMAYSRAYETYAERDSLKFTTDPNNKGGLIFYNNRPVAGTMKRGELLPYSLPNDSNGYKMSAALKNPYDSLTTDQMTEAGRLFNINCAICHGAKGGGNGPVAEKIGAVANLASGEKTLLADGTMFHVMQYGKNNMGSYASQLDANQRWMIIKYIRTLQPKPAAATAAASTDSTGKAAMAVKAPGK
ncbi:MAG: cytochrome c [Ferruginibacter sp.]